MFEPIDDDDPGEPIFTPALPPTASAFDVERVRAGLARGSDLRNTLTAKLRDETGGPNGLLFNAEWRRASGLDVFVGTAWQTPGGRFQVAVGFVGHFEPGQPADLGVQVSGVLRF